MATPASSSPPLASAETAWVISDGTKGMEIQSIGLAERMGLVVKVIRLDPPSLLRHAPRLGKMPLFPLPRPIAEAAKDGWPDLVITTGRRMAGLSILVRNRSRGATQTIHIQNPKLPTRFFDWMIIPSHDRLRGDNVLVTTGSLNGLTPEKIKSGALWLDPALTALPKPLIVVMVGGSNRRYGVFQQDYHNLGSWCSAIAHATGASLAFVPSRRSMEDAGHAIRHAVESAKGDHRYWVWDGSGQNPYPGILSIASAVIVTSDSVNMTCEACLSGKPVYSYDFKEETGRIALFHRIMRKGGYTKIKEELVPYTFPDAAGPSLDETGRIAKLLTGK